jgi:hypothetical protein
VTPAASLPSAATSRAPRRRWKPEEDAKLIEAVQKLGKKWFAVAAMVPGRTNEQCRQRWAQTLDPTNGKRGQWTPEEVAKLTKAVKKHGNDWIAVAAMVPDRNNKSCRNLNRWINTTDPANGNKGKLRRGWEPEEDAKLSEAVKKHGKHWVSVAKLVPGRSSHQCRDRWIYTVDRVNGKRGKWTPEQDAKLTEAAEKHGKD